jgi:hypothetical protein
MSISVNGVQDETSKLSYITTAAFNGSIYQYTTALNTTTFNTEGQLSAITTLPSGVAVSSTNCPAGRILRVVGRKLYPGANPGLVLGDKYQGTTVANNNLNHVWVSVFDSVTGLRGFIDPNASLFAIYSTDRNRAFVDVEETVGGVPTRLGPSIYTGGSVTAVGNVTSSGTVSGPTVTGVTVTGSSNVVSGGKLTLTNTVTSTANPVVGGSAVVGTLTLAGATPVVVNTTAVATTSKIFLSRNTNGGTPANFAISAQSAGSFSVTGTAGDTSTVNWLVVNTV